MNQMPQQSGGFQNQQNNFQSQTQYKPSGQVQSQYQGQLSQPNFGRPTQSIVGNPSGYQAQQVQSYSAPMQQSSQSGYGMQQQNFSNQSYASHQPVQSHASSPATAFGSVGPVIAHYGGYQAQSNSLYQPTMQGGNFMQNQQTSSYSQGGYGMTQTHSQTPENPVYQATNAYNQAGPVISKLGWQSAPKSR